MSAKIPAFSDIGKSTTGKPSSMPTLAYVSIIKIYKVYAYLACYAYVPCVHSAHVVLPIIALFLQSFSTEAATLENFSSTMW